MKDHKDDAPIHLFSRNESAATLPTLSYSRVIIESCAFTSEKGNFHFTEFQVNWTLRLIPEP